MLYAVRLLHILHGGSGSCTARDKARQRLKEAGDGNGEREKTAPETDRQTDRQTETETQTQKEGEIEAETNNKWIIG